MSPEPASYRGDDTLLFGIILGVLAFWLFAQTTLNIAPAMATDLGVAVALQVLTTQGKRNRVDEPYHVGPRRHCRVEEMNRIFLADLQNAEEITAATFSRRPWSERIAERAAAFITRLL